MDCFAREGSWLCIKSFGLTCFNVEVPEDLVDEKLGFSLCCFLGGCSSLEMKRILDRILIFLTMTNCVVR